MKQSIDVKVTSHSAEVLEALKSQIQLGLLAIGEHAEGFAKDDCPVDTGRLRNSITYVTSTSQGTGDSEPHGTPEETEVQVGTNVEYAEYQEYGDSLHHTTGRAHFLRDSIASHGDLFKNTMEASLRS